MPTAACWLDLLTVCLIVGSADIPRTYDDLDSVVRMCEGLGLAHRSEWRNHSDPQGGILWARRWLAAHPGTPDVSWCQTLPGRAEVAAARAMQYHFAANHRTDDPAADARALCELEGLRRLWALIDYAGHDGTTWSHRRERLQALREALGDEAFVLGRWPNPIPLWAVRECR